MGMSKRILIVEDEFIVANNLQLILKEAGYTIGGIAASATEAEIILQEKKPLAGAPRHQAEEEKMSGIDIARKLKN